jgi:hypothetical protein
MGSIPAGVVASAVSPASPVLLLLTAEMSLLGLTPPSIDADGEPNGCDPVFETATGLPPPPSPSPSLYSLVPSSTAVLLLSAAPPSTAGTYYSIFSGLPSCSLRSPSSAMNRTFEVTNEDKTPTPLPTAAIPFLSPPTPTGGIAPPESALMHAGMFVSHTHSPASKTPRCLVSVEANGLLHRSCPIPPEASLAELRHVAVSATGEFVLLASSPPAKDPDPRTLLSVLYRDNYSYMVRWQRLLPGSVLAASFSSPLLSPPSPAPTSTSPVPSSPSSPPLTLSCSTTSLSTTITLSPLPAYHAPTQSYLLPDASLKLTRLSRGLRPPPLFDAEHPLPGITAASRDGGAFADLENRVHLLSGAGVREVARLPRAPEQLAAAGGWVAYTHPDPGDPLKTALSVHCEPPAPPVFSAADVDCLTSCDCTGRFLFQSGGAVYALDPASRTPAAVFSPLEPFASFLSLSPTHVLGVTPAGRLYCNDALLCGSASSYAKHARHDVVAYTSTGSRPKLFFKHISSLLGAGDLADPEELASDPSMERNLEVGSVIVGVLDSPAVVLRAPRGNLEAV